MPSNVLQPEKALKRLQLLVKQPTKLDSEADIVYSLTISEDLATPDAETIHFTHEEYGAMQDVHSALEADLRFEYLESHKREKAVDHFACQCYFSPQTDHVQQFVDQYAQEPKEVT